MTKDTAAYFGEKGSFTHVAAQRRYPGKTLISCPTVDEAFAALESGKVERIVVPIENTSVGIITDTVDHLIALATQDKDSKPAFEVLECLAMPVSFALMARSTTAAFSIIYSHFSPLGHCRAWLKEHHPRVKLVTVVSTAEAARRAREETGVAALAGLQAAEIYKLKIIEEDVGGDVPNRTQFFVVGRPPAKRLGTTHTSLILELAHRPGSLMKALGVLATNGLNLTRIQSRPIPGRFSEYRFLMEFESGREAAKAERALQQLGKVTRFLAVAGSYRIKRV